MINLRGTVIPVMDLAKRFEMGREGATNETRIVVVESTGHLVGMVVDSVSEVLCLSMDAIEPPSVISGSIDVEFLCGVGKAGERLIVLLDLEKLLSHSEQGTLSEIAAAA